MSKDAPSIAALPTWHRITGQVTGRTVMVVGGPGTGKTKLAQYLVGLLAGQGPTVALVSADVGQPSVGVPTCLGLAASEPWDQASALWFVGDTSPGGNLLPAVVGAARLASRAREEGAETIVIDTTGLVEGPVGRALKLHKALAVGVDSVLAIERQDELEPMLTVLAAVGLKIHRLQPVPQAENRSRSERKAYREDGYQTHFRGADALSLETACLVGPDWAPRPLADPEQPPPGTLVGLLDQKGFCLGLGLIEKLQLEGLSVYTACKSPEAVVRVQVGRIQLDRHAGFSELRR